MAISFDVTANEQRLINGIARRAMKISRPGITEQGWRMDITATHANGNPLRLADLLNADDFNFAHDVYGIEATLDRTTGKLGNGFSPRYSRREMAVS